MGTPDHEVLDRSTSMWQISRGDWVLAVVVVVATGVIGCAPLIGSVRDLVRGAPLTTTVYAAVDPPAVIDPQLAAGVSGVYTGEASFVIANPSPAQWSASLIPSGLLAVITVGCLWLMIRLILDLRTQRFTRAARARGRALGLVLFCYGLLAPLVSFVSTAVVTTSMRQGTFDVRVRMDVVHGWPIVVGLGLGLFVELVWRRGRFLEAEAEGLV